MALKRLGSSKGVVMVLLTAAAVCAGFVYLIARERSLNTELSGTVASLKEEQGRWEQAKGRLEQTLKGKEAELEIANTKNYRADMVQMQDAFKEANQKLHKLIRERAELENANFILDSRLKNTTKELTQNLEELKQARDLLTGTENPHKVKMAQLSVNLKRKEQEYRDLQGRLEEMERALTAYRAQGKDSTQGALLYQERMEVLSRNVANLREELAVKNRQMIQKDVEIDDLRREVVQARTQTEQEQADKAAAELESQRRDLKQQITASQEQLKDKEAQLEDFRQQLAEVRKRLYQREAVLAEIEARRQSLEQQISASQEQLKGKEQQLDTFQRQSAELKEKLYKHEAVLAEMKSQRQAFEQQITASQERLKSKEEQFDVLQLQLTDLREKLHEREALLSEKEHEAQLALRETDGLREEILDLRSDKQMFSKGTAELAKVRRELDSRIQRLEKENALLERELASAEKGAAVSKKGDPFRDRNLRLMTEQLVKKEEEIRGLTDALTSLEKERKAWERSFGPREKRMAELEILVNTLTKQLGDYAAMIEKRDAELGASAKHIASMTEDLEAQKMAALALQKELAEARSRQERTLQKLTQLMSMNTDGVGPDDMDFSLYGPPTGFTADAPKREDPSKVRSRVEKLKRQVEVLMERR